MTLNANDFAKLKKMQALCARVEAANGRMQDFLQAFQDAEESRIALERLYEADWLNLAESELLSDAQRKELACSADKTSHSILAQDTIWNALSEHRELRISLLKSIAGSL